MPGIINVKIENLAEIKQAFKKAPEVIEAKMFFSVESIIQRIENTAKRQAPANKSPYVRAGSLRQSIHSRMIGRVSGEVRVDSDYGIFVHEGTRPHDIRPKEKKGLANKRAGQYFGKLVHHPGTKANPFMERSIVAEYGFIQSEFKKVVENIF